MEMQGDALMEWTFIQDVMRNNELLNELGNEAPITLLSEVVLKSLVQHILIVNIADGVDPIPYSSNVHTNNKADPANIFSCFTCGSPCYFSVAIVHPSEKATRYLMANEEVNAMGPGFSADTSALDLLALVCDSFDSKLKDSSRRHVFCLEHAREVEQQLRDVGGVIVLLFCHQDYKAIDDAARLIGKELGITYNMWTDIGYNYDITEREIFTLHSTLEMEETATGNHDWAVKFGINGRSPCYKKQIPYDYNMFLVKTGHAKLSPKE